MVNIIPTPKKLEITSGAFELSECALSLDAELDKRVIRAASRLASEIKEATGKASFVTTSNDEEKAVFITAGEGGEGYRLEVTPSKITIDGDGAAGAFYGIQSLRQLIKENGGKIPCLKIEDEPEFSYRGFYQDITRGRVNKLEKLKKIADTMAYFKLNSLQLYVEDAFLFKEFEGILTENDAMTAEETLEFDSYCHENFIELIPSLATFGHLFTLLQSEKYNYLAEFPNHKMVQTYWMEKQWHHTINAFHPDSIKVIGSMLEQYIPLFCSDSFNICCDETMDMCQGVNKGRDSDEAYMHHFGGIVEIMKRYNKRIMMWGDTVMPRVEKVREAVPDDTVILNWNYNSPVNEWIPKFFWEQKFPQIDCTGTLSWCHFIENIDGSTGNISSFASHAKKYGALGLLNTNWGDFGHICPFNCNLYGLMFGAQKSWNVDAETDDEFNTTASLLLYNVTEFNMVDTVRALGLAQLTADWYNLVTWYSANFVEGREIPLSFGKDKTERDAISNMELCQRELCRLKELGRPNDPVIDDIIISTEGIILLHKIFLYQNEIEGYCDRELLDGEISSWLEGYSKAWLRDDKPSGLERLCSFLTGITEKPTKK